METTKPAGARPSLHHTHRQGIPKSKLPVSYCVVEEGTPFEQKIYNTNLQSQSQRVIMYGNHGYTPPQGDKPQPISNDFQRILQVWKDKEPTTGML